MGDNLFFVAPTGAAYAAVAGEEADRAAAAAGPGHRPFLNWFLDIPLAGIGMAAFNAVDADFNNALVQRDGLDDENAYLLGGGGVPAAQNRGLDLDRALPEPFNPQGPNVIANVVPQLGVGDLIFRMRPFFSYNQLVAIMASILETVNDDEHLPNGNGDVRIFIALRPFRGGGAHRRGGGLRYAFTGWLDWHNVTMADIVDPLLNLLSSNDEFAIEYIRVKYRPYRGAGGAGDSIDKSCVTVYIDDEIQGWKNACLPLSIFGYREITRNQKLFTKYNSEERHKKGRREGKYMYRKHTRMRSDIRDVLRKITSDEKTLPPLWDMVRDLPLKRMYTMEDAERIAKELKVRIVVFKPDTTADGGYDIVCTPHVNKWLELLETRQKRDRGDLPEVGTTTDAHEIQYLRQLNPEDFDEETIYLFYSEGHYSICRKPQNLYYNHNINRFCDSCLKPYSSGSKHWCGNKCTICAQDETICQGIDSPEKTWPRCETCKRDFFTDACLNGHLKKTGTCSSKYWYCRPHRRRGPEGEWVEPGVFCYPVGTKSGSMHKFYFADVTPDLHIHGEFGFCKVCKESYVLEHEEFSLYDTRHRCFLQPQKDAATDKRPIRIYDLETFQFNDGEYFNRKKVMKMLEKEHPKWNKQQIEKEVSRLRSEHEKEHNVHIPYKIGVCDVDGSNYITHDSIEAFLDSVILGEKEKTKDGKEKPYARGAIFYAHNGSGYDVQCIRSEWQRIHTKKKYAGYGFKRFMSNTKTGSKLFSLALGPGTGRTQYDIDFKCTYLLLHAPLSAMSKMFELGDGLEKLDLPHGFAIYQPPKKMKDMSDLPPDKRLHYLFKHGFLYDEKSPVPKPYQWMNHVMAYVGPIPSMDYYFLESKSYKDRLVFEKRWIEERYKTSEYMGYLPPELRPIDYTPEDYYRPNPKYVEPWSFKETMEVYLEHDVLVLCKSFEALRKHAKALAICDPKDATTLASWSMKIFRSKFHVPKSIAVYPPSLSEWFREFLYGGRTDTRCLFTYVKGLDEDDWNDVRYASQDLPPPWDEKRKMFVPHRTAFPYDENSYKILEAELEKEQDGVRILQLLSDEEDGFYSELDIRKKLEAVASKWWDEYRFKLLQIAASKRTTDIHYLDVTSLYPYVMSTGIYPKGHGEDFSFERIRNEKISQEHLKYLLFKENTLSVAVVKGRYTKPLFHPVLPERGRKDSPIGQVFKCEDDYFRRKAVVMKNSSGDEIEQESNEHKLIFTLRPGIFHVNCLELREAVKQGFVIEEVISMYHWKEISRDLFRGYIQLLFRLKTESTKWKTLLDNWYTSRRLEPKSAYTDEDKREFACAWSAHHGIELDWTKVKHNPGIYSLSKLLLNSLWGKFTERTVKRTDVDILQIDSARDMKKAKRLLDSMKHDLDFEVYNDLIYFYSTLRNEHMTPEHTARISVPIGIFVTAQARLVLYKALSAYRENILYHDTDSVIFEAPRNAPIHPSLQLGCFLGQWTYETKVGECLMYLISGSPKNYCYTTSDGESVMKAKGINLKKGYGLKNAPGTNVNHLTQEEMSRNPHEERKVKVTFSLLEKDFVGNIHTKTMEKEHRVVASKNDIVILAENRITSFPFGYRGLLRKWKKKNETKSLKRKRPVNEAHGGYRVFLK